MSASKIIPSINVQNFQELKERVKLIRDASEWIHLDITSEDFTKFKTWDNPAELELLDKEGLKMEVHLMMRMDRNSIRKWIREGVKRIIFHIEATDEPEQIIKVLKKEKREVGVAINPETSVERIKTLLPFVDIISLLGVSPGPSGQEFQKSVLEKYREISKLKTLNSKLKLEADGGVSKENIQKISAAGADFIIAGKAIFGIGEPEENLFDLKKLIQ